MPPVGQSLSLAFNHLSHYSKASFFIQITNFIISSEKKNWENSGFFFFPGVNWTNFPIFGKIFQI
jgi:hypothetical protein